MRNIFKYRYLFFIAFLATACSTTKNTFISRTYHNVTSRYNVFFNGTESFKKGIKKAETSSTDNYSNILPIFYYSDPSVSQMVTSEMDRAIKKASKVITLHSITAKPELKKGPQSPKQKEFYNKKEFNKWIDDNYLLMGKAYVYQNQFTLAGETFKYIITNYPDQPVKYSALIWLSRVYIETGEYREAEKILVSLQMDDKMPKKYREDYYTTYTHLHVKEKIFNKAADMLEKAIKLVRKKHYKIRYTYILAQLHQEAGNSQKALQYYKKVIRMNPPYEMTFNAKINMAGSFQAGSEGGREIRTLLRKMLKDEKNKDFQDQIYYALADIAIKEGNKEDAVSLYKLSISKSVSNFNQKGLSYLALADYYYSIPEYTLAQAYYDSTMQNIENTYEDYDKLSNKTKSLTHLVENLVVYELEDSVQILAKLPQPELFAIIDEIIAGVVAREQEEAKRKSEEMLDQQYGMVNQNQSDDRLPGNSEGGSWYFYNLNAKGFGQPDFRMRWGTRKLEDNWRRKNKQSVESFEQVEGQAGADSASETKTVVLSTKTREYYLQSIPLSDSALEKSNERLIAALFNMGVIYRNEFKDLDKSVSCFEELVKKFETHQLAFPSYYNLYEINDILNNHARKEYYKNLIITKYPDNPRAKILSNPEYIKELEEEMKKTGIFYENTYLSYKAADYSSVVRSSDQAMVLFKGDPILPRFMLLRALSLGQLQGPEKLKSELDTLVKSFPDHEVSAYAKELIDYIYVSSPDIKTADIVAEAEEIYTYDSTGTYFVVLSAIKKADINQLNFNLINYNLDNFDQLNLGILKSELADKNLLVVQSFSNLENARRYFNLLISGRTEIAGSTKPGEVDIFMISSANFDKLLTDSNLSKYLLFFEKHY